MGSFQIRAGAAEWQRRWALRALGAAAIALSVAAAAIVAETQAPAGGARPAAGMPACDPGNGGITLPDGFCAVVVADNLGAARHLDVSDGGDIFVRLRTVREGSPPGGIVALRDADGDGRAEQQRRFDSTTGTGLELRDGFLYASSDTSVLRYRLAKGALQPSGGPEIVVEGFPEQRQHAAKPFAFDDKGSLYVHAGAPSNACQSDDRKPRVPGQDPCPLLERTGGIWRFDANRTGQTQMKDGRRFSTGIRHTVGMEWNPRGGGLYIVQHGRDQLDTMWPGLFTAQQNAELPSEDLLRAEEGSDFGWPFCYHDPFQKKRVLMPEYGGDGKKTDRCDKYPLPLVAFPGHWGPNDLLFYTGTQFPVRYRDGLFIAFHGSWNRAPLPQAGYNVAFVPFSGGKPSGGYEVFADGFTGVKTLMNPRDAEHRPMGLAIGPDGSLYVSDSMRGTIWRVMHKGSKTAE